MAYRRSYRSGRRYRRRAVARVRTVTGKTASFVKLPSYKNMAYRGNERSGVLHEIKFVKQIPISFQASTEHLEKNYIFLYVNCMEELIKSADFLKYAAQYQDYCPYAVTVSTSCPVSLVGNCLLTNKLYDWPYFSTLNQLGLINQNSNQVSYYKQYLLPSGTFYSVGNLDGNDSALVTLSTFDTFFASHSTSKKLWNANIPYGVRYARYYATSAQKAMVNNIISDTTVYASQNQYDGTFSTTNNTAVNGNVADINLLVRQRNGVVQAAQFANSIVNYDAVQANPVVYSPETGYAQPYTFDRDTNVAAYLWSLQRAQRGQFNPFYYVGVNCNQTTLTTTDAKQILTLTFKFYIYFKNEISNFFQNVAGGAIDPQNTILQKYLATVNNQAGDNAGFALNVDLQQQLAIFRRYQQNLLYVNTAVLQQSNLWTIREILRRRVQNTQMGNYLLSVYRDDPTIYAFQRNGFVVDESCYNPSLGKYVFQGYIDLTPTGNANYLLQNRYEPEANTTDSKFITNYAQTAASSALRDDMVDLNVAHTCPQWSQILEFQDYADVFQTNIVSCYNICGDNVVNSKSEFNAWSAQLLSDFYAGLGRALAGSIDFAQVLENIQTQDPYFYSQLGDFKVRLINGNQYWDSVNNTNTLGMAGYGDCFHFTYSQSAAYRQQWYPSWTNSDVQTYTRQLYLDWIDAATQDINNLALINKCVIGQNTFSSLQDLQQSVLIFLYCPITSAVEDETWSVDGTLTWNDVAGSPNIIDDAGQLYPTMATVIPGGQFTNGQIVVFDQLVKDVVFQVQSLFADAVFNGLDPTVMDLTQEDFYIKFIQASNFPSLTSSTGGWFTDNVSYQQALKEAQDTFYSSIPASASKVWKKIKGFFKKAWTALKTVGKGIVKIGGATLASAYIPGGSAIASTMVPSGIKDIVSSVSTLVVSGKKKQAHYINNRLVGLTKTNSTGLVKVLITPGVCALSSAQPVDLDSPSFVDLDTTQVDSIDIGDVTDQSYKVFTVRHSKMIQSLPSFKVITDSGEEVDASFVQARLKVQIYMDKPSEDFVLPTTAICVGCDNYYEQEEQVAQ